MDLTGGPSPMRPRDRVLKSVKDHNDKLFASILKLKADGDLCDVTIKCRDFEVKAHKMILAASTDYFKEMFQNGTKESQSQIVDFSSMNPDVVKQIVDFIYTGSVWFSMDIARKLLDAVEMMQLPELSDLCVEFLANNVDVDSYADALSLIRRYKNEKLKLVLKNLLDRHFEEFRKTTDFLFLDYNGLVDCLGFLEEGYIPLEEQKWFGILSWTKERLERKEHFNALFKMVDLHCLHNDFLSESICSEDFVRDSVECLQLIQDVLLNKRNPIKKLHQTREMNGIVSVNTSTGIVYQYHLGSERWSKLTKFPSEQFPLDECSITMHQGIMYMGDGQNLWSFDGNEWNEFYSVRSRPRQSYNVCVCVGRLVVMVCIDDTVIFDTDSGTARHVSTGYGHNRRKGFFIATSMRNIFVIGGVDQTNVERLQIAGEVGRFYSSAPPLTAARAYGIGVWYEKTLYAIGGGQQSVEFLNNITEQWQLIQNLEISCYCMKPHIANNKLYVLGSILGDAFSVRTFELDTLHVSEKAREPTSRNIDDKNICCGY